jgi:AMMECR1 domain-containing protein
MTLDRIKYTSEYLGSTVSTTNSFRGCIGISMPFSTDLTRAQVVLYSGIPALIYTALTDGAFNPSQRVKVQLESSPLPDQTVLKIN